MTMDGNNYVLMVQEIEEFLESLKPILIPDIGNPRWYQQHEKIFRLSMQASLDVKTEREEVVKEFLVTFQKVPVLVHELIAIELWRLKVFPRLLKMNVESKAVVPIYMVLYHEATLLTLMEASMFHDDVVQSADDVLVDLVDYCYRNVILLISLRSEGKLEEVSEDVERLREKRREIQFESGLKCISLLCYLAQHVKILPLCVLHRLLNVHDIPLLLVNFMDDPPWLREKDGHFEKFHNGQWTRQEAMKISKTEGQIWIALVQLLLNPDCQKKYDISGYKKNQLLKLRAKLNQVLFDQIPLLKELLRFLEHLNLFDAPTSRGGLVIEQLPEIWECLQKEYEGKWTAIAEKQMMECFSPSESELQSLCQKFADFFDLNHFETLLDEDPICAGCGIKGLKRCSRCKTEWYCGRTCQVSNWPKHQATCNSMTTR